MPDQRYARRLIRGSSIVFIFSIIAAGLAYLLRILYARMLSPETFGLFYAVFAFVSLFIGFKGLGTNSAAFKYIAEYNAKGDAQRTKNTTLYFTIIQFIVFGIITLALVFFSDTLAQHYFKNASANLMLIIIAIAFLCQTFESMISNLFSGLQRMGWYAGMDLAGNIIVLGASLIFFALGMTAMTPVYALLATFVLT
ncbi:MAG: oligosaccharide flippase family protein, partial [Patescibacteria group bacterium]